MDINKIKPIDDLFNSESGYDTPKKINRSTEIVPNEILSEIENGISLETLEKLKFPIFKYRTQITIHGQFDNLTRNNIENDYYKTIFQNQNKSIGIKWNAIDFEKKNLIYKILKHLGYNITHNSNSYYATKALTYNEENVKILTDEYNKIDDKLYIGSKDLYVGEIPFYGKFIVLDVIVNAILMKNLWPFINKSFNIDEQSWKEIDDKKKAEQEEYQLKLKQELEEYDKKRESELANKNAELSKEFKIIKTVSDIPANDCIMFYIDGYSKYLIKKYTKKNEIFYQVMRENQYEKGHNIEEINQRLTKYNIKPERIQNYLSKYTVFLYKVFGDEKPIDNTPDDVVENPNNNQDVDNKYINTNKDYYIVDYTDKSIAVFGKTYSIKDKLIELGGKFNKFLINPTTGNRESGWIFSKYKREKLEELFENNNSTKHVLLFEQFIDKTKKPE
jgi:hypothetical protein